MNLCLYSCFSRFWESGHIQLPVWFYVGLLLWSWDDFVLRPQLEGEELLFDLLAGIDLCAQYCNFLGFHRSLFLRLCSISTTRSPRNTSTGIPLQRLTSQFQEGALLTANQWLWLLQTRLSFPTQQQMLLWRWETRRCHRPPEHHQHSFLAWLQKLLRLLHQLWTKRMTMTLQKRTKKKSQEAWLQSK